MHDEKCFKFHPIFYTPCEIPPLQFLEFIIEVYVSPREAISALALTMMGIVASTLLPTKPEQEETIAI